ncbi:peptide deformylase, mitochondrial isoform X1 [Cryptotermes secundus]|uniref:peptide deformylase, mitochondrial isoform X1 n=1 Tax=Cryptotermes secundus TaxID=105785 RepID=UPI000CD7BD7C|nr:peptide deformylase, mitochondrial isoform X1 [Cryptotermes secundus]XP_033611679.1 peptide deformylase, mitochondrial isoform X1 [Cryptotermes secundus]
MTILNVYRSKSALVYTLIFIKRHLITFRKFRQLYTEFWFPSPSRPPYNHICQIGDPVLRYKAEELNAEDIKKNEIQGLLKKMRSVMHSYGSFGLAAPQVGVPLSIFIVEFSEKIYEEFSPEIRKSREMAIIPFKVFINPELKITNYEKVCFPEACESVRGFSADVPRYREVLVTGLSAEGKPVSWQVSGWAARIVQHEMDHLSGRLYTDIMVRSTFTCTCWDKVNRTGGRIYVPFSPK